MHAGCFWLIRSLGPGLYKGSRESTNSRAIYGGLVWISIRASREYQEWYGKIGTLSLSALNYGLRNSTSRFDTGVDTLIMSPTHVGLLHDHDTMVSPSFHISGKAKRAGCVMQNPRGTRPRNIHWPLRVNVYQIPNLPPNIRHRT